MSGGERGCEFMSLHAYFVKGGICESEWYDKRGAFLENVESTCRRVADKDKQYCPRHELLLATVGLPPRWKCIRCQKVLPERKCECMGTEFEEIPVEDWG